MSTEIKFIKKANRSTADSKAKLVKVLFGGVLAIIGVVLLVALPDSFEIGLLALVLGVGTAGIGAFGIASAKKEQATYIAFTDSAVVIQGKAETLKIPFESIIDISHGKSMTMDFVTRMFESATKAGNVLISYKTAEGKEEAEIFGAVDNVKEFTGALKNASGK